MSRRTSLTIAVLALSAHGILAVDAARKLSITYDEYWHLPVGVLNATQGRFDFERHNPPLARMWCALPVIALGTNTGFADAPLPMDQYGRRFREANPGNVEALYFRGRIMQAILSVLIGTTLFAWTRGMFGDAAAALTVVLWSCCPNILAGASVVTTDLAAVGGFVFVLYATWRFANASSWRRATVTGTALGLSLLLKFTCVILVPLAPVCWWCFRRGLALANTKSAVATPEPDAPAPVSRRILLARWGVAMGVALVVVNFGFLFQETGTAFGELAFESRALRRLQSDLDVFGGFPVPLPRDFLLGIDQQRALMQSAHAVYLDGAWSDHGFPHYYVLGLLYKLPHPLQALALLAAWLVVRPHSIERRGWTLFAVLLPAIVLTTIASLSQMQLGVRYILPAFPFLMILAGQTARWTAPENRWTRRTVLLLAALSVTSLRFHPHHVAYFNELAGGPIRGREHLVDSNIDWGQDLLRLRDYVEAQRLRTVGLAYFGTVTPASVGLKYRLPPSWRPQPGTYAVSVNFVMGRPSALTDEKGEAHAAGLDEYGYFRAFTPVARIGYSIDVYHLTALDVLEWQSRRTR